MGENNELTDLPNIGKVVAEKLKEVGIATPEELRAVGAEQALFAFRPSTKEPVCACCRAWRVPYKVSDGTICRKSGKKN
jgi:hypothetical protein